MLITRPELVGDFGMVASTHWLASSTGMSVLERGGNAADAAAAAGLRAPGGRAAPQRAGRRGADPVVGRRGVQVICGQGVAPRPPPPRDSPSSVSTSCPAPACCPPSCRARSARGCCCWSGGAPGACAMSSHPRSRSRRPGIRCWPGCPMPSARSRTCSVTHWPTLGGDVAARRRGTGGGQPLPQSGARAAPTSGSSTRRRPRAADRAGQLAAASATSGTAGSWPRRSASSVPATS